jgi:hypothetical protein
MLIKREYAQTLNTLKETPKAWIYSNDGIKIRVASSFWEKLSVSVRWIFNPSIFGSKLDQAISNIFSDNVQGIIDLALESERGLNTGIFIRLHLDKYVMCSIEAKHPDILKKNSFAETDKLVEFPIESLVDRSPVIKIASWIDQYSRTPFKVPKDHYSYNWVVDESKEAPEARSNVLETKD